MRDRSQSSFSVSYKNMKKSPSLQSLDSISIDSYLMDYGDPHNLLERGSANLIFVIYILSYIEKQQRLLCVWL